MKSKLSPFSILLIPAALGVALLVISMHHGPGIGGDATIYLKSAENLLKGVGLGLSGPKGEFRLIPYFPPFYSLVLAMFGAAGIDLVQAAWGLNILLFAGLIYLTGLLVYHIDRSILYALLASALVLFSPVLLPVYSWAMSEPLAIFLGFTGIAVLIYALKAGKNKGLMMLSAFLCGLAFLTRYAAASFLALGMLAILLFSQQSVRSRIASCVLYFVTGFTPMLVWLVIDWMGTATVASRSVMSTGIWERFLVFLKSFVEVLLFWFIPDSWIDSPPYPAHINSILLTVICLGLLIWGMLLFRTRKSLSRTAVDAGVQGLVLSGLFCLGYFLITAIVYLGTYPPITIGSRMYAPMHVAFLWLLALLAAHSARMLAAKGAIRFVPALLLAGFCGWYAMRTVMIARQNFELGQGYLSPAWQTSQTLEAVKKLPKNTLLVTNEETALLFLANRESYPLAEIYWIEPDDDFDRYGEGDLIDDNAQRVFREEGAALVLFDSIGTQLNGLYGENTTQRIVTLTDGLNQIFKGDDGAIYTYPVR